MSGSTGSREGGGIMVWWASDHGSSSSSRQVLGLQPILVYVKCMSRTNVNIDDKACAEVMRRYRLTTKRQAINFALRALAAEPLGVEEARRLRGSGWDGDLDLLRSKRPT